MAVSALVTGHANTSSRHSGLLYGEQVLGGDLNPELAALAGYWEAKRGGNALPRRADLDPPMELRNLLGCLAISELLMPGPRVRYRLVGTRIVEVFGRDGTGKRYDELYDPPVLAVLYDILRIIECRRRPIYFRAGLSPIGRPTTRLDAVVLPLSRDGEALELLLTAVSFAKAEMPREDYLVLAQPLD